MLAHWQEAFLTVLRRTGNVSRAAAAVRKDRSTVYYHRDKNREFARQISAAMRLYSQQNLERVTIPSTYFDPVQALDIAPRAARKSQIREEN